MLTIKRYAIGSKNETHWIGQEANAPWRSAKPATFVTDVVADAHLFNTFETADAELRSLRRHSKNAVLTSFFEDAIVFTVECTFTRTE